MSIGQVKVGGTAYNLTEGPFFAIAESSPSSRQSKKSTNTGAFSFSDSITAPAGHDYMLVIYIHMDASHNFTEDLEISVTNTVLGGDYSKPTLSSSNVSTSIVDFIAKSDADKTVAVRVSGNINVSSASTYYYYVGHELLSLN